MLNCTTKQSSWMSWSSQNHLCSWRYHYPVLASIVRPVKVVFLQVTDDTNAWKGMMSLDTIELWRSADEKRPDESSTGLDLRTTILGPSLTQVPFQFLQAAKWTGPLFDSKNVSALKLMMTLIVALLRYNVTPAGTRVNLTVIEAPTEISVLFLYVLARLHLM